MVERHLFRGKRMDNKVWAIGFHGATYKGRQTIEITGADGGYIKEHEIDPTTIGQCTGCIAEKSYRGESEEARLVFEGDITSLTCPDGEVRNFVVEIKTVERYFKSHPDFDDPWAKVSVTGVVFTWRVGEKEYSLYPCVDGNGISDVSRMKIVGNIHDHPGLIGALEA